MKPTKALASAVLLLLTLLATQIVFADALNLGQAANYAVLGTGGTSSLRTDFEVYQSATVVNGNVGVGPYSTFTHGIDATINGKLFYDNTDTLPIITGTITGGTVQQSMTQAVMDAVSASNTAAGLAATQTFSTLTENQIITGNGGLNVIVITGDVTLKKGLTLSGGASDRFIFVFTGSDATSAHQVTLSGMTMTLVGGVVANNILWDLNGGGGNVVISSGATVDGTFLAPFRSITVDNATINGRVIGGGSPNPTDGSLNFLSIHSSSQINAPAAVPEPSSMLLLGTALAALVGSRKKGHRERPQ